MKIEIKWALIYFVMNLVWILGERIFGLHGNHIDQHATYTTLILIPAIAVFVLSIREKKLNTTKDKFLLNKVL